MYTHETMQKDYHKGVTGPTNVNEQKNDTWTKFGLANFDKQPFLAKNIVKLYYFTFVTSIKKNTLFSNFVKNLFVKVSFSFKKTTNEEKENPIK